MKTSKKLSFSDRIIRRNRIMIGGLVLMLIYIGTSIVNHLLEYIKKHTANGNFTCVGLTAAEGKETFYERFGFNKSNGRNLYIRPTNRYAAFTFSIFSFNFS